MPYINFKIMTFKNFTPHTVVITDRCEYPSLGIARVSQQFTEFNQDGVCSTVFGDLVGLPEPEDGVLYIVSAMVLSAGKALGRKDLVAPATGHPNTVRNEKGFIVSVPGFIR